MLQRTKELSQSQHEARWIEKLFCTQYRLLLCYVPSLMRLQSASSFRLSQTLWLHGELRPWIARVSFDCRPKTVTIQCWAGTCNRTIPKWLPCIRAKCSCNPAFHLSGGTKLLHWSFHYGIEELQPKKRCRFGTFALKHTGIKKPLSKNEILKTWIL